MNEALCQNEIYVHANRLDHRYIVPNVTLFGWESDMVSVTKANYIVEYEIKCSRADFQRDKKKYRHRHLSEGNEKSWRKMPAYFYYVAPRGLLKLDDIPAYAGLISLERFCMVEIERKAPRLHMQVMTEQQRQWLERGLTVRYWNMRKLLESKNETNRT